MGEEVSAITFEILYDFVRKEKTTEEIEKLNPQVYEQIISYLKTKALIYKTAQANDTNPAEVERIKDQITSARKLIKEFYERRERKIILLALNRSRGNQNLDSSNLLDEEKLLFEDMTKVFDKYRKEILLNLVNAKQPVHETLQQNVQEANQAAKAPVNDDSFDKDTKTLVAIRFTAEIPRFMGVNLEVHGPYVPGDNAILPKIITDLLIKNNKAELLK